MGEEYLEHHGILGQKWGHQNGPPYPLNPAKDYSAAEKKAAKKDLKSAKNESKANKAGLKANKAKIKELKARKKLLRSKLDSDSEMSKAERRAIKAELKSVKSQLKSERAARAVLKNNVEASKESVKEKKQTLEDSAKKEKIPDTTKLFDKYRNDDPDAFNPNAAKGFEYASRTDILAWMPNSMLTGKTLSEVSDMVEDLYSGKKQLDDFRHSAILMHSGVKGMKWGKRKSKKSYKITFKQPEDKTPKVVQKVHDKLHTERDPSFYEKGNAGYEIIKVADNLKDKKKQFEEAIDNSILHKPIKDIISGKDKKKMKHSNSGYLIHFIGEDPSDTLKHYGVKGMKWGKRKSKLKFSNIIGLGHTTTTTFDDGTQKVIKKDNEGNVTESFGTTINESANKRIDKELHLSKDEKDLIKRRGNTLWDLAESMDDKTARKNSEQIWAEYMKTCRKLTTSKKERDKAFQTAYQKMKDWKNYSNLKTIKTTR